MTHVEPIADNCNACGSQLVANAAFCHRCGVATDAPREMLYEREKESVGREWRTRAELFGVPLVHYCQGVKNDDGSTKIAKGIIANGEIAIGVFAMGGMAFGLLAMGGVAVGVIGSVGGVAFGGGFAFGGIAVSGGIAAGGVAVGSIAAGGLDFTWPALWHRLFG